MASDAEKPYPARKLLSTGRLGTPDRELRGALQSRALPRESEKRHTCRRILRTRTINFKPQRKDQEKDNRTSTLAIPQSRCLISNKEVSKVSLSPGLNL